MILLAVIPILTGCHRGPDYYANPIAVVMQTASSMKGTPYRYGGRSPKGFDCSGFAWYCYHRAGLTIPTTTDLQRKSGDKVARSLKFSKLKEGDLLFFKINKFFGRPNHVGIYAGHNHMIHASPSRGIVLEDLDNHYWKKHFVYARRIVE